MRVAVLGGGISGCALGAELARGGVDVVLFEGSPRLGGLHRSVAAGGCEFDIGTFVFGDDHAIFSLFPEVRPLFPHVRHRFGSVRASGVLDDYPMTIGGVRREFGSQFVARVALEVLLAKVRCHRRDQLRDFIEYYIGPTLYRTSGLKTYIERLYLAPDLDIDIQFARQRLSVISTYAGLRATTWRVVRRLTRFQKPTVLQPPTGDYVYVRPPEGFDAVYERIEASLRALGVELHLSAPIRSIRPREKGFVLTAANCEWNFDRVFSTIPLVAAARALALERFTVPESMALYSLFYTYDGVVDWPYTVLHNFTPDGQWKRLTMFSRYYGPHEGKHYFTVEGTARGHHDKEGALADGREDFAQWLKATPLFDRQPTYVGGTVTRQAYPVFKTSSADGVRQLKRELERLGLILAGRQGNFDYITSSDAAGNARIIARGFLESAGPTVQT